MKRLSLLLLLCVAGCRTVPKHTEEGKKVYDDVQREAEQMKERLK